MATHDYVIDNQTAPNFRADLNNVLLAIVSNNSSATSPVVTYANMMWYDTAATILYMRNEDNDAWIRLGTLDQTADTFAAAVALASQAEAETGTDNTKVMTPLRLRNALNATGTAPTYACRAWVNFQGTGTVTIRSSGNVSSVTDNGIGDYTVNYTTALPTSSPTVVTAPSYAIGEGQASNNLILTTVTSTTVRLQSAWSNFASGGNKDVDICCVAVFC